MLVRVFVLASLAVTLTLGLASAQARQSSVALWVSPSGNDSATGKRHEPLLTLQRARDLARTKERGARNVTIYLQEGTFRLSRPLTLSPDDSGQRGGTVTYRAAPGATPVVSGAVSVSGWKLYDRTLGIYRARVPKVRKASGTASYPDSRQLYVNGRRATRARSQQYPDVTRTAGGYQASDGTMAHWREPSALEAVTTTQWKTMRCGVQKIEGSEITMRQPCWTNANVFPPPWNFQLLSRWENAYELLDKKGEWFLDQRKGWLYYIPRVGEVLAKANVELPVLETLVEGTGTANNPISDIIFKGITFSYATWLSPSGANGYASDQSGFHLNGFGHKPNTIGHDPNSVRTPGNVSFRYAHRITFSRNTFRHLGAVGLDFGVGSQDNEIIGNRFSDISSAAIQVGGVARSDAHPANKKQVVQNNTISHNTIRGIGREFYDAAGIYIGFSARTLVSHNQISEVPWSGVALGWGWGLYDQGSFSGLPGAKSGEWGTYAEPTTNRDNRVVNNRISHFLQVLWDGGAIYTNGAQGTSLSNGLTLSGNVMTDKRVKAGGNVIYTDGGSRYITISNNVLLNNPIGETDFGPCDVSDALSLCGIAIPYGSDRGGCLPYGDFIYKSNYWQHPVPFFYFLTCNRPPYPVNVTDSGNRVVTGLSDVPRAILKRAGPTAAYR